MNLYEIKLDSKKNSHLKSILLILSLGWDLAILGDSHRHVNI